MGDSHPAKLKTFHLLSLISRVEGKRRKHRREKKMPRKNIVDNV